MNRNRLLIALIATLSSLALGSAASAQSAGAGINVSGLPIAGATITVNK